MLIRTAAALICVAALALTLYDIATNPQLTTGGGACSGLGQPSCP